MRKYINYNNSKAVSLRILGKNILVVEIYLITGSFSLRVRSRAQQRRPVATPRHDRVPSERGTLINGAAMETNSEKFSLSQVQH